MKHPMPEHYIQVCVNAGTGVENKVVKWTQKETEQKNHGVVLVCVLVQTAPHKDHSEWENTTMNHVSKHKRLSNAEQQEKYAHTHINEQG